MTEVKDVPSSVYPEFHGIWKCVDQNMPIKLSNHPSLLDQINNKQRGYTPLLLACLRHNCEIVQILLEKGANPNLFSRGRVPLYTATLHANMTMVELLLVYGANPNLMSKGIAPLHLAASKGIIELCNLLVVNGADVSINSPLYGTPLHVCVKLNHQYIARYLISGGASLTLTNPEGETPIFAAAKLGRLEILSLMLPQTCGKDVAIVEPEQGLTSLHVSAKAAHYEITEELAIRHPKLIGVKDFSGRSVLFYLPLHVRKKLSDLYVETLKRPCSFVRLVNKPHFSDVLLLARDGAVNAHSPLLHLRWPSLRAHLKQQKQTQDEQQIKIHFLSEDTSTLLAFVHYLYTDRLKIYENSNTTSTIPTTETNATVDSQKLLHVRDLKKFAQEQEIPQLVLLCDSYVGITGSSLNQDPAVVQTPFVEQIKYLLSPGPLNPYSDIALGVKGDSCEYIHAHKALLACNCDFFSAMFDPRKAHREVSSGTIYLESLDYHVLHDIVTYIYLGRVSKATLFSTELLEASARFLLPLLNLQCQFA
eukprot:TRINITY_DN3193_c0_g1_i20.p1 TRINITY_DN3193_c0_g1~~TRINITY_DN3193_c0_g1_i20.p1  ORF type:complete len:535 (-),score=68.51 TRINITY_DN3193_c0_g1_i20:360-1964(-)